MLMYLFWQQTSAACTIFVMNNGSQVWVGSNEDNLITTRYNFRYYPSKKNNLGYVLFVEELNGLLKPFSYLAPQGGLNTSGLFADYAFMPNEAVTSNPNKKNRKRDIVSQILSTCKTVDEALQLIDNYNLVKLSSAQLFLADASGNYAVVHGNYVYVKQQPNFAITNFKVGKNEVCYRHGFAQHFLSNNNRTNLTTVTHVLQKTSQPYPNTLATNYSMAVNLSTATIYLYHKGNFNYAKNISLKEELAKGKHANNISKYFPTSITKKLVDSYSKFGVDESIKIYKEFVLSQDSTQQTSITHEALKFGVSLIQLNANDAATFLEVLKESSSNFEINVWLNVAYKKVSSVKKIVYPTDSLTKEQVYLHEIWLNQKDGTVNFVLPFFEQAQTVTLHGVDANNKKVELQLTKENDVWQGKLTLPKGWFNYKFKVDNDYYADGINTLHKNQNGNMVSLLWVW